MATKSKTTAKLGEAEKKYVHHEMYRMLARAARKACEDGGFDKNHYLIDSDDLKKFYEEDLRIVPLEGSKREQDTEEIYHETYVNNPSSETFQIPTANKTTIDLEETKKTSTTKLQVAIEGGKEYKQDDSSTLPKGQQFPLQTVPSGTKYNHKNFGKDEYKTVLAKAYKDYQFCVYLGKPVRKGALVGGGTGVFGGAAAGAGIGVAVGSIVPGIGNVVGAGVGAAIGAVTGITVGTAAGAGIGAGWQTKVFLSAKKVLTEYGEDQEWYEEGKCIVYKVKYYYKHLKDEYDISDY